MLLAPALGGCSLSYKLEAFSAKEFARPDQTSAVKLPGTSGAPGNASGASDNVPGAPASPTGGRLPPDADLALAKAAVHDLLSRGDHETSLPWENPHTGARGTVTPIAEAYTQHGFTCRDFLASYVRAGTESWMQGEACRIHQGKWEVKSLRSLSPT